MPGKGHTDLNRARLPIPPLALGFNVTRRRTTNRNLPRNQRQEQAQEQKALRFTSNNSVFPILSKNLPTVSSC